VTKRRFWLAAGGVSIVVIATLCVVVYRALQPGNATTGGAAPSLHAELSEILRPQEGWARAERALARYLSSSQRRAYFETLQPVALANCELERFGEANDGGYLMCGNLLGRVQSGYSYGISGYDGWGCDISTKSKVTVHEYDCFNTTEPACPKGATKFHAECVGDKAETVQGRVFDTVWNQLAKNGDRSKRIALKMDVEGAEWDALPATPDEVFEQIDQFVIEFHGVGTIRNDALEKQRRIVERLKQFFVVAHIHYNNATCSEGIEPFPTWAYEVLFVNKQLAIVDQSHRAVGPHPLDAPNIPSIDDCQPRA
jgi:hypothetical protein